MADVEKCDKPWAGDLERKVVIPTVEGNPYDKLELDWRKEEDKCEGCDTKCENYVGLIKEGVSEKPHKEKYLPSHVERPTTCDTLRKIPPAATLRQVGGNHYKDYPIQPVEFIVSNKLSFLEGCVIKRICRYKGSLNPLEDLEKLKHEVDLIIELEGYALD